MSRINIDNLKKEIVNKVAGEIKGEIVNRPEVQDRINMVIAKTEKSIADKINISGRELIDKKLTELMKGTFKIIKE